MLVLKDYVGKAKNHLKATSIGDRTGNLCHLSLKLSYLSKFCIVCTTETSQILMYSCSIDLSVSLKSKSQLVLQQKLNILKLALAKLAQTRDLQAEIKKIPSSIPLEVTFVA